MVSKDSGGMARERQRTYDQSKECYQDFIQKSREGIWRFELEKPISVKLSQAAQIKKLYEYAYLAEANTAMASMYGFRSPKPMIGMRLDKFLIKPDAINQVHLTSFIENDYSLAAVESHELDKRGRDKYFLNSLVGIVQDGHLVRVWGTQLDITDRRSASDALQRSEERLNLALQAAGMGLWEWDVTTNDLYWSPILRKIYGVKASEVMTYEKYVAMIHPEDRDRANEVAMASMQTGETYQFEHRIIKRDGSTHWLLGTGKAFLENGKPVRMVGTSMNIDAVKQAQELRTANELLRTQRAELLELNRVKDEFIALASHQLRTPATAVKQYISLLINEMAGPLSAEQLQYLQVAFNSNERQLRIINDLLKTAQIDSSLYALSKQSHDFTGIIRYAVDELETMFDLKNQKVVLKGPKSIKVDVDEAEMKLVLINLLENASKYSYPGTEIVIQIRKTGKRLEVSITDAGVGIHERDAKRIFDKFTRADNELSDTVSGTGLGLYWVERIVKLHGGTIRVNSTVGKGSTFTVTLPL